MGKLPSCISPECLKKIQSLNSENEVKQAVEQNMSSAGTTIDALQATVAQAQQYIKEGAGERKRQAEIKAWDASRNRIKAEMKDLPGEYQDAEKHYLSLVGWTWPDSFPEQKFIGDAAYKNKMYYDYKQEAEKKKVEALLENEKVMEELQTLVNNYKSALIYAAKMDDLLEIRENENKNLSKALEEMRNVTLTNDRRVYYEGIERESISYNRYILYFFFYGIFIFTFIFGKNPLMGEYGFKTPMFWLIVVLELLFLTFPFWVDWLVRQLFRLYGQIRYFFNNKAPRDVYTSL